MVRSGLSKTCRATFTICAALLFSSHTRASSDMVQIGSFAIDKSEVTIGAFSEFVSSTGVITDAEKNGGGLVYTSSGWTKMPGWNWRTPYGKAADTDEPAVHVTFGEASQYCRWRGKRLPTDVEWTLAAYTEMRVAPPLPFEKGKIYSYPTGDTLEGANCLGDCGDAPHVDYSERLDRGKGHAKTGTTRAGVNGLYDMGANVWEWVENGGANQKGTRGGSWWYGKAQMHRDHIATKPRDTAAVYIGFRCVK